MKRGRIALAFFAMFAFLSVVSQVAAERQNPRRGRVKGVVAAPSSVPPGFS